MNLELLVISTKINKPRQDLKLTSTDKYNWQNQSNDTICTNHWYLEVTLPHMAHSSRYMDVKNNKLTVTEHEFLIHDISQPDGRSRNGGYCKRNYLQSVSLKHTCSTQSRARVWCHPFHLNTHAARNLKPEFGAIRTLI